MVAVLSIRQKVRFLLVAFGSGVNRSMAILISVLVLGNKNIVYQYEKRMK